MVAFSGDVKEFAYLVVCDFVGMYDVLLCINNDVISMVCCWEYDGFVEFEFGVDVLWEVCVAVGELHAGVRKFL